MYWLITLFHIIIGLVLALISFSTGHTPNCPLFHVYCEGAYVMTGLSALFAALSLVFLYLGIKRILKSYNLNKDEDITLKHYVSNDNIE